MEASRTGDTEMVQLLLEKGDDPNMTNRVSIYYTCMIYCKTINVGVIIVSVFQLFAELASITYSHSYKRTCLF